MKLNEKIRKKEGKRPKLKMMLMSVLKKIVILILKIIQCNT